MKCALVKKTRRGKKLAGRKYCREKPGSLQQSVSEIVVVENNYLSSKQIGAWSAEMKSCKVGGGDCDGIIRKYEEQVPPSNSSLSETVRSILRLDSRNMVMCWLIAWR